jgi:predicted dehydrogenase
MITPYRVEPKALKQVIQNYRTGRLAVSDVPAPTVRSGFLLVANRCSLISAGTEKSTVSLAQKSLLSKAKERPDMVRKVLDRVRKDGLIETAKMVFERLDTPAALGYSCAGTVLEVGAGVEGFSVGDRVACAGQNYASHADVVAVPKNLCARVPDKVEFEEAAFVTLGAIALQGIRQTEPRLGDRVAVIGLGLLGQLTVQMLKASGCLVLGSDFDTDKLALAKQFGADVVAPPGSLPEAAMAFTGGQGIDAVLITASAKDNGPVETAGEILRRKGRVVVVGAVGMTLPREPYYKKELELRLSTSYGPGRYDTAYEEKGHDYPYGYVRWTEQRNMEAFLTLLEQGKVDVKPLVTHRYAIAEAENAYTLMLEAREPYLGILLSYPYEVEARVKRVMSVGPARPATRVTLGLIGAGHHVKDMLLPRLLAMPDQVRVRAICTNTGIHAKALAEKTGAEYCTTDYRDVLNDSSVNAVVIGTRHDTHGTIVVEALRAGKHVFVEKPLCLTETELEEITAVYQEKAMEGVQLMVGFNRRFSPHADRARAFFAGRRNPLVMLFRVNAGAIPAEHWIQDPDTGGGRIIGEACHFIDYMQAVCGAFPVSVHALRIGYHSSGLRDDQSILSCAFADGSIGTLIYAAGGDAALAKERFEAFGDGKSLVMDDFTVSEFYAEGKRTTFKLGKRDKGFQGEMSRFVRSIVQGAGEEPAFEEIHAVTRACLLAVESLRTGQTYRV